MVTLTRFDLVLVIVTKLSLLVIGLKTPLYENLNIIKSAE